MRNNTKIKVRNLLLSIFVLLTHSAFGQVAIIQDKDGFTNVRSKPTVDSEIVYVLKENEVFCLKHNKAQKRLQVIGE